MVYTLPDKYAPHTSFGNQLFPALTHAFQQTAVPAMQQEYQRGQLEKQLMQAKDILSNPNLDEESKQIGLYQSLSGRPDIAKHIYDQYIQSGMNKQKQNQIYAEKLQNQSILADLEAKRGLEKGSLKSYGNNVKLAELTSRPQMEPRKTQASQPIDPDQLARIQEVRKTPGYNDLDEVDQYRLLTDYGVSKENAEAEAKLTGAKLERKQKSVESSYKAQEQFINETTNKYKAFETETKPRLLQMQKVASDGDLISAPAAAFLETLGIPLGALEDPSSELYNKLSLDLLKGLPETYGNRILKVEVDNFLKTVPTLLNSPDGRRMIASNMLKLGEMKEIYYDEMRRQQKDALDYDKPLPKDFQQRIFDQVRPQVDRLNNEFVKMSEIKAVPEGTVPFFDPNGNITFVPKEHAQWASDNGGKRIW
jgi:hypothetical protein